MKKWLIILIVTFVCSVSQFAPLPTAFSQSRDEALKFYQQGMDALNYGRYQEALAYFEQSLRIGRSLNYKELIAANLNNIGGVYNFLGRYEDALKYYEESLKIYKELNIPQGIATSLNNIGGVYDFLGRYEDALKYYGGCVEDI